MGRVYHENPPAARTQQGFQQASFGGRGAAGAGMSAGRWRHRPTAPANP